MCSPFEFFDVLEDVKCPDVSLEDVELSDDGEDWVAKFQSLEPPPFNVLESCYFDNAENDTKTNNISSSSNEDPRLISDNSSGKKYVRTCSPVSVLDSNSTISRLIEKPVIPFKRPRSKRKVSRRRTFNSFVFAIKRSQHVSISDGDVGGEIRRCTHCQGSKTPQWREGPLGPKTLCNACGVRYRSGRLFPEYRPVASPTFIPSVHSNSHRKVLEMRKKSCQFSVPSTAEYLYS